MASAMCVSSTTLHRRIQSGDIQPYTNAIKPKLTEANKLARLKYCLSMISLSADGERPMFHDMMNYIHIDEKWFLMSKETQRYYKLPDENPPLRCCKSKKFVDKVMFLGCVARSRFDESQNEKFDGNLGIFPFVYDEPAKRSSKNRPAGTMLVKPIQSITKEVIKRFMIEKLLPAIREKWPGGNSETIWIQQDNARPHVDPHDKDFVEAATLNGYDIRLCYQPPNSPDMNVLDLGYFRAIQSLQQQEAPSTIEELIEAVQKSFQDLHYDKLNKIFLTLQLCMQETMKVDGCNNYKQPHFKDTLQFNGQIPLSLQCDESLLLSALAKCSQ